MLRGELSIKIKEIKIIKCISVYDMTIIDEDGGFLHIVGDNDLPKIFQTALDNIKQYNIK